MKDLIWTRQSEGEADTIRFGRDLGRQLWPGSFVGLVGSLGAGKTTFVRGLGSGLDRAAAFEVSSPSYTLVHEYPTDPPLFHIDLYRLLGLDDLESTGFWDYLDQDGIVVVEWMDRVEECMPDEHLVVQLKLKDESRRTIEARASGERYEAILRRWGEQRL